MHTLMQLEKQQVGLRLPRYLVEDIDEFTNMFSLNRTDIIIEAIKSYINEQKTSIFYEQFDDSCKELKKILNREENTNNLQSLDELIDELKNN